MTTEVYKKHGLIPEMCDVGPPNVLKITYAGNRRLENNMAMELTPTQVGEDKLGRLENYMAMESTPTQVGGDKLR